MMKVFKKPPSFDGVKFAALYNLRPLDFYCDANGNLVVPDTVPDKPVFETPDPVVSITTQIDALQPQDCPPALKVLLKKLAGGK